MISVGCSSSLNNNLIIIFLYIHVWKVTSKNSWQMYPVLNGLAHWVTLTQCWVGMWGGSSFVFTLKMTQQLVKNVTHDPIKITQQAEPSIVRVCKEQNDCKILSCLMGLTKSIKWSQDGNHYRFLYMKRVTEPFTVPYRTFSSKSAVCVRLMVLVNKCNFILAQTLHIS